MKSMYTEKLLNEVYVKNVNPITYLAELGVIRELNQEEFDKVTELDPSFKMNFYLSTTVKPSDFYILNHYACDRGVDFFSIAKPNQDFFKFVFADYMAHLNDSNEVKYKQTWLLDDTIKEKGIKDYFISLDYKGGVLFNRTSISILDEILFHHFEA